MAAIMNLMPWPAPRSTTVIAIRPFPFRSIAVAALLLVGFCLTHEGYQGYAQTPDTASNSILGGWTLNKDLSDQPNSGNRGGDTGDGQERRGGGGGRRGGFGGGFGGGRRV